MLKTRIDLNLILPAVPDERDECVSRIIQRMQNVKGIESVHLVSQPGNGISQLCFHYDPDVLSIKKIEDIAKSNGAEIENRYGHVLAELQRVLHPTQAKQLETDLLKVNGILTASVAGTGMLQVEFDKNLIKENEILQQVTSRGTGINKLLQEHPGSISLNAPIKEHGHPVNSHSHIHGSKPIFGEKTELVFAITCGIFLLSGFVLSFLKVPSYIPLICYIGAYIFGGYYTSKEAIHGIRNKQFEIDFLMIVAAIGAAALGEWAEGALLLFLFSLGHSLEHFAMAKAKKSIAALTELAPKTAILKQGSHIKEVNISELAIGDIIIAKPNSKIPADGIVLKGSSSVNQAPITGESIPVDKSPMPGNVQSIPKAESVDKHTVFAGTINGNANLEISVTKIASDSTIARLIKLVNEAQTQKSPTQHFTDRIEKYYVPSVLILVVILLFAFLIIDEPFSASFYRAMAVLVAASPCALAISTPSAVLSGVARAARGGVLIKGGRPLEELGTLNAIAFDKTGTLTEGKPKLTGVETLNGITEEELLRTIIAVEKLSDHPLAAAIVKGGMEKLGKEVPAATNVQAIQGRGVKAIFENATIHIGNKELFTEKNNSLPENMMIRIEELEKAGNTTMIVQKNETFIGIVSLMDVARKEAKEALEKLSAMGIRKMIMLTGDNQNVAEAIARETGITDAWGNLLPEQKVAAIEKLRASEKKVAMVGDGVNDAPAMAKSTVGIAMGAAGSDVALETADIALMADKLENLPFAIGLSKKAHKIIRQNIFISLGMVAVLVPLTMLGIAKMGPAVIGHEGSTIVVVFNALRLLAYKK